MISIFTKKNARFQFFFYPLLLRSVAAYLRRKTFFSSLSLFFHFASCTHFAALFTPRVSPSSTRYPFCLHFQPCFRVVVQHAWLFIGPRVFPSRCEVLRLMRSSFSPSWSRKKQNNFEFMIHGRRSGNNGEKMQNWGELFSSCQYANNLALCSWSNMTLP